MSLHDLLEDLASHAPSTGAPPEELWQRGRRAARARRLGTVAIVMAACLGLLVVSAVSWQARTTATPSSRSGRAPAMPDRLYAPSGWLPSFDRAPGTLAAIIARCQNTLLGSRPGLVGVSATTGRYAFVRLPHAYLATADSVLAPDGHAIAFWTEGKPSGKAPVLQNYHPRVPASLRCFGHRAAVDGFAVYDVRTGHTTYTRLSSLHGIAPRQLAWAGDHAVWATYGHLDSRGGTGSGTWASLAGVAHPSAAVLADLSGPQTVWPAGHGRVLVDRTSYDADARPQHFQVAHELVDLATGTGRSFTGRWGTTADVATAPSTAVVSPDGNRSAYAAGSASTIAIARLAGASPVAGTPVSLRRLAPTVAPTGVRGGVWIALADGWIDEDHLAVTVEQPGSRQVKAVQVVSVADLEVKGVRTAVTGLGNIPETTRFDLAYELLAHPTFHAHEPPSPLGLRKELGLGAGVAILAAGAILLWRRRAHA